jgi:hypothetical protein
MNMSHHACQYVRRVVTCLIMVAAWGLGVAQEAVYPRQTAQGIEFAVVGTAGGSWVIGDFNEWGRLNDEGVPQEPLAKLEPAPDGARAARAVPLTPGTYRFRYLLAGRGEAGLVVPPAQMPVTPEGDNVLIVKPDGTVAPPRTPFVYAPALTADGVEFRVYAPAAKDVFLAGSFNNWADAAGGVVSDLSHRMYRTANGDFVKRAQLPPGVHEYAVVLDGRRDGWLEGSSELPRNVRGRREFRVEGSATPVVPASAPEPPKPQFVLFPPRVVPGGVQFAAYAPGREMIYLAGDFNGWGNFKDGVISNPEARMEPNGKGYFFKTVALLPDTYCFKYCLDGQWQWEGAPEADLPRDKDLNSVFTLKDGRILEREGRPDPWVAHRVDEIASAAATPAPTRSVLMAFFTPGSMQSRTMMDWLESAEGRREAGGFQVQFVDVSKQSTAHKRYRIFRVPTVVLARPDGTEVRRINYRGTMDDFIADLRAVLKSELNPPTAN